ncbi:MAG: Gfo/Idh/MocA family oxidoreductase [Sedimentisphaerales bacterium]|nr:Gfo/Idh/MocA family oxidoreductase [Sedimentisphaerales bacterium]
MAMESLTAAVLGLDQRGRLVLDAASRAGCFQIKAVADQDAQKAEKAAAKYKCDAYTDYRQLIVQNQLDCLLLATDIHPYGEHLKTAIKRKFNILKLAPPARNFEEACEYVQMADSEKVRFAVANPARFHPSYITAHELILQGHIEHIYLITGYCSVAIADRPSWYADPKLAGGGVLMHDCYPIIDQMLWSFPVPQQVYALHTNGAPDKQRRPYLTEDTSVVSLRFTDALVGNITATRRNEVGPNELSLTIYGKDALLTVTDNLVTLNTCTGQENQRWQYGQDESDTMRRLLASFARSITNPEEPTLITTAAESLHNMAVLESAYLSARTGFPEEPARILQLARNSAGKETSV